MGDREIALGWLDRAVEARDLSLVFMRSWPLYKTLAAEPLVQAIRGKIGLPGE